ncbi:MAG TPA: hypothetical protein VK658_20610 [Chryseolinea sp.]|nr:hypothetical protein [Chryseolinea sp.]
MGDTRSSTKMEEFYSPARMSDLYQTPDNSDLKRELEESAKRKLRTLRMLLILWVVSFAIVLCWFTLSRL